MTRAEIKLTAKLRKLVKKRYETECEIARTKFKLGKLATDPCLSADADLMCKGCDCWKKTREMCS